VCSVFSVVRFFFILLAFALPLQNARAVEYGDLAKYWTADALHVPYRAIVTPGRAHDEKLPLIVFLHGDWQDGTDNESQLAGYGNGSLELVDRALDGHVPLVYVAPQTTDSYWPPARVAAVVHDALARFPIDPRRIYLTGISNGGGMVNLLACRFPQRFAGVVEFAPAISGIGDCRPARPISMLEIHGSADPLVAYGPIPAFVAAWARLDGCASAPTAATVRPKVTRRRWHGCRGGAVVEHLRLAGGHHIELLPELRAAGVDAFIYMGCDVLATLEELLV